jgi:hypothetical protein
MGFHENCPVLKVPDAATRDSHPAWCDLTARVLKQDLETPALRPSSRCDGKRTRRIFAQSRQRAFHFWLLKNTGFSKTFINFIIVTLKLMVRIKPIKKKVENHQPRIIA